jgi:hypothetical protein
LHPEAFRSFGIYAFGIKKKIKEFWGSFPMFWDRLYTWNIPFKKLPNFGMYYEIIPWKFVKNYGFKNITRTNNIISQFRNFKHITGTSGFFLSNFGNFHLFRKYSYRSSGKWYELHGNFPKFCEKFNYYGLFRYRKPEI